MSDLPKYNDAPGPIAYLTGEYPRATDTFIQREVAELRAQGIHVETCSMRRTDPRHHVGPEQVDEAAGTFHVLEATKNPFRTIGAHISALTHNPRRYFEAFKLALRSRPPGLKGAIYQLIYFAEAGVLAQHLQDSGITHLHNHIAKSSCSVAMLASKLSGIPFSFTLHGPDIFFEPHHWRLDIKIAEARFVSCISHFCRAQAMNFSAPAHWRKLHIVHCGIDPERYGQTPRRRGTALTFVGRLSGVKGVRVLFEALETLVDTHESLHVTMIGDGPERAVLVADVEERVLDDHVTFVGYKSQADVADVLATTDIFVLPSFAEGVPVVLMEAMGAGVPVITTHVAGIPELVEDGVHGLLTHPGSSESLGAAIDTLIRDPQRAAEMGARGQLKVRDQFNIKREGAWLAALLAAYQDDAPDLPVRNVP